MHVNTHFSTEKSNVTQKNGRDIEIQESYFAQKK